MRGVLIVFGLIALLSFCGGGKQKKYSIENNTVYVCSGRSAKRYHSVEDCKGFTRCSGSVLKMSIEEAEEIGKSPCRMCVKSISSRKGKDFKNQQW